jgi:hypothetical protein
MCTRLARGTRSLWSRLGPAKWFLALLALAVPTMKLLVNLVKRDTTGIALFPYSRYNWGKPDLFSIYLHVITAKSMPEDRDLAKAVSFSVKDISFAMAVDAVSKWHGHHLNGFTGVVFDSKDFDADSEPVLGSRLLLGVRHRQHQARVALHRPWAPSEIADADDIAVHVIIPHRNRCERLASFAQSLNRLDTASNVYLVVSDFNSSDCNAELLLSSLNLRVQWRVMSLSGKFSRTLGLQLGCSSVPTSGICLMMDVDLVLPSDFMTRVRMLTLERQSVYAPIW